MLYKVYRRRKIGVYEANSDGTEVELGSGVFFKKGSIGLNSWKERGYKVLSNRKLIYFEQASSETKGVIDLTNVSFATGPVENCAKCAKVLNLSTDSICSNGLFALTLDLNQEESEKLQRTQKMSLVFRNKCEAQSFVLYVAAIAVTDNFEDFVLEQGWEGFIEKLEEFVSSTKNSCRLTPETIPQTSDRTRIRSNTSTSQQYGRGSMTSEFSEMPESSLSEITNTSPMFSGMFYKRGHVRKNWKERYVYVTESGLLVYKKDKDNKLIKGKLLLPLCEWFRRVMKVKRKNISFGREDVTTLKGKRESRRIIECECMEIIDLVNNKRLSLAFDFVDEENNVRRLDEFEQFLNTSITKDSKTVSTSTAVFSNSSSRAETSNEAVIEQLRESLINDDEDDIMLSDEEFDTTSFSVDVSSTVFKRDVKSLSVAVLIAVLVLNSILKHPPSHWPLIVLTGFVGLVLSLFFMKMLSEDLKEA